jgi:hypothetical protein
MPESWVTRLYRWAFNLFQALGLTQSNQDITCLSGLIRWKLDCGWKSSNQLRTMRQGKSRYNLEFMFYQNPLFQQMELD